ncbi:MAG: hypothetical protein K2P22_10230 [Lachnospiraceae bacterium]|nr:hypothetical protein [Lachnospiraceae bacterium]
MSYLKGLGQFNKFDLDLFLAEKCLTVTGLGDWQDYQSKELLGTKVEVTITEDKTLYKTKGNVQISNLYNKLIVKVPGKVDLKIGTVIEIVGGEATVYGEYRNQLSIKATSVRPVTPANGGGRS